MPLLKCTTCHHEWEGRAASACDWCGSPGRVLAAETPLEALIREMFAERAANHAKNTP